MEYFDSRGVPDVPRLARRRRFGGIWRDHAGFDQRFSATLGQDYFEGLSQLAETPGDWQDDLKVSYRRRA